MAVTQFNGPAPLSTGCKDMPMPRHRPAAPSEWIEMIRIRMDPSRRNGVEDQIMAHLKEIPRTPDAPRVTVRRHLSIANDLMVVLQWPAAPETAGSSLAYSLCREFEAYGLVDHTIWSTDCLSGRIET